MTQKVYGNDQPSIFETLEFINSLLVKSNTSWSEAVARDFNSEVQNKIENKAYWAQLSNHKSALNETTKHEVMKELVHDLRGRAPTFTNYSAEKHKINLMKR